MKRFTFIKLSFMCLIFAFFFIPKDTEAYQIQAYWASDNWQVQGICQDTECSTSTGAYIQHPSYHCLTILGIEFEGNYQANHNYHNDVRITIPSSNTIAPWQNLTGQDLGWYPYGQPTNFTRETLSPASPSNPQYYPTNFFDRTYNLSYDFTPTSNITKFGYYFYFNNNNCQNIGGVRVLYYNTTDLSGPVDDNESIIQNQNKNTNDIINNQNQNTEEIKESIESIGDTLTDDDIIGASEKFEDEINNGGQPTPPQDNTPLSSIINLPLQYLRTITNNTTCSNLTFTIPYMNTNISIPCITSYLSTNFSSGVVSLVQLIVNALILYRVCISFWHFLHDLRDPHTDDLEVVDL